MTISWNHEYIKYTSGNEHYKISTVNFAEVSSFVGNPVQCTLIIQKLGRFSGNGNSLKEDHGVIWTENTSFWLDPETIGLAAKSSNSYDLNQVHF